MTQGRVATVLALAMTAGTVGAAGAAAAQAPPGRVVEATHEGEAGARRYRLYVPAGGDAASRPLVVLLHGCTQTAADLARGTRMDAAAEEVGALVLYPEQSAAANAQRCWNWYDPAQRSRGAGEAAILADMTRAIAAAYGADPRRTYVAGISAGGAMAVALAAAYPELYAAAGSHSGVPLGVAHDVASALAAMRGTADPPDAQAVLDAMGDRARAVPLLVIHGEADAVVAPSNARALTAQWAAAGGEGAAVELQMVPGLGHAWSGGDPAGSYASATGPDATRLLLRFLLAHPMPGGGR